ncbi:MAG: molecular chaperone HtpG [Anaerolineae bacterium]|nr:molecular chaperone HtpG [Anaerolineae bacterium]
MAVNEHNEQHAFKAEIQQLLNILIHSLYTDREIFLRELISNASDALNRVQFEQLTNQNVRDPEAELYVEIKPDEDAGTLTISDTGIGMTHDDLVNNLGTIAHSGARAFVEALRQRQAEGASAQELIGQFGVGFYSVFMVADKVRVVTRSANPDEPAWAWESTGADSYSIEPTEKETRGTDVIITLKDDAKDFLQTWTLQQIVRRHSDYIAFPIYVGDGEEAVNKQTAIWRQDSKEVTDEQYNDFYKMLTLDFEDPLHRIHMRADVPLQFYALLYSPASAERSVLSVRRDPGLKLYARKVLIQEYTTDLLPEYLAFVQGVVDSEDLPLNVSRESVQANRVMANLKKTLTNKVLSELKRLAKNKLDEYHRIFEQFGRALKQGLVVAPMDRAEIEPLLLFPSTRSADENEWTTLADYVSRMVANQQDIYYVLGEDFASASRSPHLDSFRQRGIEVLYLTDPVDPVMLMGLSEFDGHKLRSADEADIDLRDVGEKQDEEKQDEPLPEGDFGAVRQRFVDVLGERVVEVRESKNLVGSPARLVSKDSNPQRNMFRINRLMERDYELPVKILELNPRHPLLHNLSAMIAHAPQNPLIDSVVEQVFETALLQDGIHPDPAAMAERLYALMQAATEKRD